MTCNNILKISRKYNERLKNICVELTNKFQRDKMVENLLTPNQRPFRVSIEGNIGSGKSTLINYFKQYPDIEVYPEPISCWRNVRGWNLLEMLYTDLKKWSYSFQHYVQLSRLQIQTSLPSTPNIRVQMFERSVQNNRFCFAENSYKNGLLTEAEFIILCKWYDWIEANKDIQLDLIVYLRSTPEIVHQRMLERARSEESSVPLEYLKQVHSSYEDWLMNRPATELPAPVLVIDVDQDLDRVAQSYEENSRKILGQST